MSVVIGGEEVRRGSRKQIEIPIAKLPSGTNVALPVVAIRGKSDGPAVFLNAAIHGDEISGVDIILTVLERLKPREISGMVIAVPVVNVFGFITASRYLPDRRDLNRSFPGNPNGSLAARVANLFMTEVVTHCQYGIDFHAGSHHRTNLPQLRADLSDPETLRIASAWKPMVIMDATLRTGSLREAGGRKGVKVLVHEAGEPSRFDPGGRKEAVDGVFRVLYELGIVSETPPPSPYEEPILIGRSKWVRASRSGVMRPIVDLGERVAAKQKLGVISDIMGSHRTRFVSPFDGVVLGLQLNPMVNRGDALVHVGEPE